MGLLYCFLTVTLRAAKQTLELLRWESPATAPNRNIAGPTARTPLPAWDTDRFQVEIAVEEHPEMDARYTLAYRRAVRKEAGTAPMNITE